MDSLIRAILICMCTTSYRISSSTFMFQTEYALSVLAQLSCICMHGGERWKEICIAQQVL